MTSNRLTHITTDTQARAHLTSTDVKSTGDQMKVGHNVKYRGNETGKYNHVSVLPNETNALSASKTHSSAPVPNA